MTRADPVAAAVLADLLLEAAETGRLMEAHELLTDLAGPALVSAAHGICIDRYRDALDRAVTPASAGGAGGPSGDNVFDLTRRLRAETSRGRP